MKYLLILTCLLFFNINYSQEINKYYVEIIDKEDLPTYDDGKITFSNNDLMKLFRENGIEKFDLAFPGATPELLKRVFILECEENFITLLNSDFSNYFRGIIKVPEVVPLFLPNDFGFSGGQPELDFIRAQEAWDITLGNANTLIGINDLNVNTFQEDLVGKTTTVDNSSLSGTSSSHGTLVSSISAANTNNGIGMSAIGYNCSIRSSVLGYSGLMPLVNSGVRVINMSWGGCLTNPIVYEDVLLTSISNDHGVVLVAAAGNGSWSCPAGAQFDHFPASYNNVISVTNVGHHYEIGTPGVDETTWKDVFMRTNPPFYATFNENVDISAPGRGVLGVSQSNASLYTYDGGTSISAPMVTGLIGLMFSVNPCLFPDEVESILKLTAFRNDLMPQNSLYQGLIGAGRIDAFRAVDMANDMADQFGTVEVENRIIDRWIFRLRTNPFNISMENNIVSNQAILDFNARNAIDILSGDYVPSGSGSVDLKIDTSNNLCNTPSILARTNVSDIKSKGVTSTISLYPNPNDGNFTLNLEKGREKLLIKIIDIYGKTIYNAESNSDLLKISLAGLSSGVYFVKINGTDINEVLRFIKK